MKGNIFMSLNVKSVQNSNSLYANANTKSNNIQFGAKVLVVDAMEVALNTRLNIGKSGRETVCKAMTRRSNISPIEMPQVINNCRNAIIQTYREQFSSIMRDFRAFTEFGTRTPEQKASWARGQARRKFPEMEIEVPDL